MDGIDKTGELSNQQQALTTHVQWTPFPVYALLYLCAMQTELAHARSNSNKTALDDCLLRYLPVVTADER